MAVKQENQENLSEDIDTNCADDQMLTIKEAAEVLGITTRQVRRLINAQRIKAKKCSIKAYQTFIPMNELLKYKECRWQRKQSD